MYPWRDALYENFNEGNILHPSESCERLNIVLISHRKQAFYSYYRLRNLAKSPDMHGHAIIHYLDPINDTLNYIETLPALPHKWDDFCLPFPLSLLFFWDCLDLLGFCFLCFERIEIPQDKFVFLKKIKCISISYYYFKILIKRDLEK